LRPSLAQAGKLHIRSVTIDSWGNALTA
jgi:hypothetical protein